MSNKVNKILFSLAETDKDVQLRRVRKAEIEQGKEALTLQLEEGRERLSQLQAQYSEAASKQKQEESRLQEEELKIIERRKQITAIGGVKSAKLVERELEIATRLIETLEKSASDSMQLVEQTDKMLGDLRDQVSELEQEIGDQSAGWDSELSDLSSELGKLEKERTTFLDKIDDRLKNLYAKVNTRYPGDAVATAIGGSCRSCYRSLPAQTYNQVMAGNTLIQCPGCSRILVYGE